MGTEGNQGDTYNYGDGEETFVGKNGGVFSKTDTPTEEEIKEALDSPANPEDFTEAEHAAVDDMAEGIVRKLKAKQKFQGKRCRKAWNRMNRPSKTEAIDRGAAKVMAFIDRVIPQEEPEFLDVPDVLRNQENLAEEKELAEAHRLLDIIEDPA